MLPRKDQILQGPMKRVYIPDNVTQDCSIVTLMTCARVWFFYWVYTFFLIQESLLLIVFILYQMTYFCIIHIYRSKKTHTHDFKDKKFNSMANLCYQKIRPKKSNTRPCITQKLISFLFIYLFLHILMSSKSTKVA